MLPSQRTALPVYSKSLSEVIIVPSERVHHAPPVNRSQDNFAVLCDDFDPDLPLSCSAGNTCKYVHADIHDLKRSCVHVNYAWPSLAHVTYERYSANRTLHVTSPNARCVVDTMHASFALKTRGLETSNKLTHCAHYYYNRVCHLGPECQFIHAVFIDPEAQPGQLAPDVSRLLERRAATLKVWRSQGEGHVLASRNHHDTRVVFDSAFAPLHRMPQLPQYSRRPNLNDHSSAVVVPPPPTIRVSVSSARPRNASFRFDPYNTLTGITVIHQRGDCL